MEFGVSYLPQSTATLQNRTPHQRRVLWTDAPPGIDKQNTHGMVGNLYAVDDDTRTFARVRVNSSDMDDNALVRAVMSSMSQADQDRLVSYVNKHQRNILIIFLACFVIYLLFVLPDYL
jgi:hypothetical protein